MSFYQFPLIFLLLCLFQLGLPHLCLEVPLTAFFHSPALQSDSRSSIFDPFRYLLPDHPLCLFFVNASSSLSSSEGAFGNYVSPLREHRHCVLFNLNSMKEAASPAPISQSIGYFVKVGTLPSPLESSMPFLSINLMLCYNAQRVSGRLQGSKFSSLVLRSIYCKFAEQEVVK